jgi:uncharacterized membrane-anchored protein
MTRQPDDSAERPHPPFENHPERQGVVSELHLRRMAGLSPPVRLLQTFRLLEDTEREAELAHIAAVPLPHADVRSGARHLDGRVPGGAEFLWERHNEASTMTLVLPHGRHDGFGPPYGDEALVGWLYAAPGRVLRATQIMVVATDRDADPIVEQAQFDRDHLVSCLLDGGARMWSDFRIGPEGFGRHVIAANGMMPSDLGRVVQRIQELGNYRNLALRGLKTAQDADAELRMIEAELVAAASDMAEGDAGQAMLERLEALSARSTSLVARTSYRLRATQAYSEIVSDRLRALHPTAVPGYQSLTDFTERRLLPAVRTTQSFALRLHELAERINGAIAQIQTRAEFGIHQQSHKLLLSMTESADRQMKIQRLVEGLSIVGVTYYAISLLEKILFGFALSPDRVHLIVALAIVPTLLNVRWLIGRHWRRFGG